MKLSDATLEIEEYLDICNSDSCLKDEITEVQLGAEGEYRFFIWETSPYRDDSFFFTITTEGKIINQEGKDCIETCKSAYDNDPALMMKLEEFENKWYLHPI